VNPKSKFKMSLYEQRWHVERKEAAMWAQIHHKLWNTWSHQRLAETRNGFPHAFKGNGRRALPTSCLLTLGLRGCGKISPCCLTHLLSCSFVTAALGTKTASKHYSQRTVHRAATRENPLMKLLARAGFNTGTEDKTLLGPTDGRGLWLWTVELEGNVS
jgi:hypothetical protein